jgi:hypothetical protein
VGRPDGIPPLPQPGKRFAFLAVKRTRASMLPSQAKSRLTKVQTMLVTAKQNLKQR